MYSVKFDESDLNVEYVPKFIEKDQADSYFSQLSALPFYTPTFTIRGKSVKPKRQVLAYGDSNASYAFSGTTIPAEPWTQLLLELRDLVEQHTACTFNYVLLNLYSNGSSYISQHKDNETGLDATFPIAVLSFGGERTIEFKRPKMKSTLIKLEHGSLYLMEKPTNELFTHGIAPEAENKSTRISLTFRHVICTPKKPRLDSVLSVDNCSPAQNACLETMSLNQNAPSLVSTEAVSNAQSETVEDSTAKELSEVNDWLTNFFQEFDPLQVQWNINRETFIQILVEENSTLRICIQKCKQSKKNLCIKMVPDTWFSFQGKLSKLEFQSEDDSFVCNNQLLTSCISTDSCLLQQIFPLNTEGFFLKPTVLKLFKDQVTKTCKLAHEINESIIEAKFIKVLPRLILRQYSKCREHIDVDMAKQHILKAIVDEIRICTHSVFKCEACFFNFPQQNRHECLMISLFEKFNRNREEILIKLNLNEIVTNLSVTCFCHYSDFFFKQFNVSFYNQFFDEALINVTDM